MRSAEGQLTGPMQLRWLEQLETESDNVRGALGFALRNRDADLACELAGTLWRFWQIRGHIREGRDWLTRSLGLPEGPNAGARARALCASGFLAFMLGDYDAAKKLTEQSLSTHRTRDDRLGIIECLHNLGLTLRCLGDDVSAEKLLEEGLQIGRSEPSSFWNGRLRNALARVKFYRHEYSSCRALLEASLHDAREAGDSWGEAINLDALSDVHRVTGELTAAESMLSQSLTIYSQLGDERGLAQCIEGFGFLSAANNRLERAARLFSAAGRIREIIDEPSSPARGVQIQEQLLLARAQLGSQVFEAAWDEGRRLCRAELIALAAQPASHAPVMLAARSEPSFPLTPREQEVAALVARGLTNRQIADELVIGTRTADAHVSNILNKLGFASRAQIAGWAVESGLTMSAPVTTGPERVSLRVVG